MSSPITSVVNGVGGRPASDAAPAPTRPGWTRSSARCPSPTRPSSCDAAESAKKAQAALGGGPGAGPRPRDRPHRPADRGQRRGAGPAGHAEIGKPYAEALGEVREIVDTCDFFLGEGRRLYGQTVPSEMPDKQLFTFRKPVGTVAVITAGNFPVAVPSWYIVPALLAGQHRRLEAGRVLRRRCSAAFHELFVRGGGLPDGVFNIVHADGPATFAGLERSLEPGLIDKVGFTGSSAVGREIGALTGRHLQTACLELGGKNPLVVTPSADLDLAVEGALFSGFGTAGQRCTVARHGDRARVGARRVPAPVQRGGGGGPGGRPDPGRADGPDAGREVRRPVRGVPRLDPAAPHGPGAPRAGSPPTTRGTASSATRAAGCSTTRWWSTAYGRGDGCSRRRRSARSSASTTYRTLSEAIELANAPGLRAVVVDLHHRPAGGVHLPGPDRRGHGVDQQLDLRRRGTPAVRRQREVRQRVAAVRDLGARPVHPLAVGQLGLLRPAAEGADGHRRADPGHHASGWTPDGDMPRPDDQRRSTGAAFRAGRRRGSTARLPTSARLPDDRRRQIAGLWWRLFEAQAASRQLDFVARELQAQGAGFYTIGSAGHESQRRWWRWPAADRSGAAALPVGRRSTARAPLRCPGSTPVRDVLQGLMGLADEPIAGGRHKVFGHPRPGDHPADVDHRLAPAPGGRAGDGAAPGRPARRRARSGRADAVVVCSFGDASANHSTAAGAINTALNAAYRGLPVPILFVCEDNGLGISVPTPAGWIEPRTAPGPGCATSRPTAPTPVAAWPASSKSRPWPASAASAGVPAPADRAVPRPRRQRRRDQLSHAAARWRPTMRGIRCWPRPVRSSAAARPRARCCERYDAIGGRDRDRGGPAERSAGGCGRPRR